MLRWPPTLALMKPALLLLVCLALSSGCSSTPLQYEVEPGGSRQSRAEAEKTHAERMPQVPAQLKVDSPAHVLSSRFPDYPSQLQQAGIVGNVIVQFFVEPDGSVSHPMVLGAPPPELTAITLHAIMQWRFSPATRGGAPVRVRVQQQFRFQLE